MITNSLLRKVARLYGIQTSYKNIDQKFITAPNKTLIKMISDLSGATIEDDDDLYKIFREKKNQIVNNSVAETLILWNTEEAKIFCYTKDSSLEKITFKVFDQEDKLLPNSISTEILASNKKDDYCKNTVRLKNNSLPVGYYNVEIVVTTYNESKTVNSFLVVAPSSLVDGQKKSWGPFIPLYALRSQADWGIGTFKELKELVPTLKKSGASWISLLPILAGNFDHEDCDPSPYSALTRLFWNEIYLDVERLMSKYPLPKVDEIAQSSAFQNKKEELAKTKFVNYFEAYKLKKEILIHMSDYFFENQIDKEDEYISFLKKNPKINDYAKFRSNDQRQQNFHKFCQFEMNLELDLFSKTTGLGLYMDYPVGVNDAGFDFKDDEKIFFKQVSVGAPPEPVFALGQDWGFPAFHPINMIKDKYKYFRESLQNHLKFSNILRLDHIMGLHRIYSVPKGYGGSNGAYLKFPKDHLFAIVITEAYKAGVDLIGENLGTVPLQVDETINKRKLNGMWVLQCETWQEPKVALEKIIANQLVCVNTHDMPMLKSFIDGTDLILVNSLKILSDHYKEVFTVDRKKQMEIWGGHNENFVLDQISNIAKSPAKYFVVNLEDIWSEEEPQNIPGTWKEYPNWRKKFSLNIHEMINHPKLNKAFEILNKERGV